MKKNVMLKIAAVLLVAVLLTTCAISSTFAKYTSTFEKKGATARVAKWGVTVTTSMEGGFGQTYADDAKLATTGNAGILAPGASGTITLKSSVQDNGTEVSYTVAYDATVTNEITNLKFKVGGVEKSAAQLEAAIEAHDFTSDDFVITWEWPYHTSVANDTIDTNQLGDGAKTVAITLQATVTQVNPGNVVTTAPWATVS